MRKAPHRRCTFLRWPGPHVRSMLTISTSIYSRTDSTPGDLWDTTDDQILFYRDRGFEREVGVRALIPVLRQSGSRVCR